MYKFQKLKPQITKVLPLLFAALTVISAVNVYNTHKLPLYITQSITLLTYKHTGTFNYTAVLKPNIIYNKTTLKPGEGILYDAIVNQINLTYSYAFDSFPKPISVSTDPKTTIQLESPEKWTRTLTDDEAKNLLQIKGSEKLNMLINHTKIQDVVDQIDKETGIRSSSYNLKILSTIRIKAETQSRPVEDVFTQELAVAFISGGEKGNYISIEDMQKTESDKITQEKEIYVVEVEGRRRDSYLFIALSSIALGFTTFLYIQGRPKAPPKRTIKKIIDPYKDLITETTETPLKTEKTINMKSLEDLAKIAEILARPIIHATEAEHHIFYIIDNETKYQYKTIE